MNVAQNSRPLHRPFVLPRDVLLFPVTELSDRLRGELDCAPGDYAVTRPGYRSLSRIVDAETAALLEEFRCPSPLAEAVLRYSRRRGLDPEELLERAFPVFQSFSTALFLVPEDSPAAAGVEASFAPGQTVGDFEIRRLIQALDDTELYQARHRDGTDVALKIARAERSAPSGDMLEREAAVLRHLDGGCCPRLVAAGRHLGRPFLANRWLPGVAIHTRAAELRRGSGAGWREDLHRLVHRLLDAYRVLHERGVVHADVHPRNVLVDAEDRVSLLDFGLSLIPGRPALDHERRAGLVWYLEPEAAGALLRGEPAVRASFAGEQYSLAALVYFLISGEHLLAAVPEREAAYREICRGAWAPFARRGFESWPEVEAVLERAASLERKDRFASTAEFCAALKRARPPRRAERGQALAPDRAAAPLAGLERCAEEIFERTARGPELGNPEFFPSCFPEAPTASVQYGAAGLAWFLYRAAQMRDDPELLAAADLWSRHAVARLDSPEAFEAPELGIRADRVGPVSFYHRAPGVCCVAALVRQARGDLRAADSQIRRFLRVSRDEAPQPPRRGGLQEELAFGRAGLLLGGALLLEMARACPRLDAGSLAEFLEANAAAQWAYLQNLSRLGACAELPHLGVAHGWAGVLFAQLRAREALGLPPPEGMAERLDELAELAEPLGRGAGWVGTLPHAGSNSSTPSHAPGWCSGSAGHVYLFTLAHERLHDRRYLDLAERAAWLAWEHPDRHPRLCCGLSGRAFALLRLYRHTGEPAWLERARELAGRSALALDETDERRPLSLFWGKLGPALLGVELTCPERSAFPLFDSEGWS